MKPAQVTRADIVKNLAMIIAQVMVRALSREPNAKVGGRNQTAKATEVVVSDSGKPSIRSANRPLKGKPSASGQGQVNHPTVLVAVNAVAEIALVAIDLGQTDAAIVIRFTRLILMSELC